MDRSVPENPDLSRRSPFLYLTSGQLVDIDLAILGADPARFAEYDTQVREEYRWVPESVYRSKRREVLAGFLARPAIYGTGRFRDHLEGRARENLSAWSGGGRR